MPGPRARHPGLPDRWPAAWSSLWSEVIRAGIVPVIAAGVVALVLVVTETLHIAWWVLLIPLLALLWPLSLPHRVRSAVQRADRDGSLQVVTGQVGVLAVARRPHLSVRPSAEVVPGRAVRYRLNGRDFGSGRSGRR